MASTNRPRGWLSGHADRREARYHSTVFFNPSSKVTVRLVAEQPARLFDVGLRVADVAGARRGVYGLDAGADKIADGPEQLVERDASAGGDVDHFPARAGAPSQARSTPSTTLAT